MSDTTLQQRPHSIQLAAAAIDRFCPGLLNTQSRAALVADGRQLPDCYDWAAFEYGLKSRERPVDLSISVSRAKAAKFVAELAGDLPEPVESSLKCWASDAGDPALRRVSNTWLEFDHATCLRSPLWSRGFCFLGLDGGPHPRGADSLIRPLAKSLGFSDTSALEQACALEASLPADAQILNVATLHHRGRPELRLHFSLPRSLVGATLPALGWPGCSRALADLLQLYETLGLRRVAIQLALSEGLAPAAGFELYLPHSEARARWCRVVDWLAQRRLLSEGTGDWLPNWQGRSTLSANDFPGMLVPAYVDVMRRAHVKVTIEPAGLTGAKAYLFAATKLVPF